LNGKLRADVQESGVNLCTTIDAQGCLSNRHANLVLLILENLIHNALKATPAGKRVGIRLRQDHGGVCCEVADQGLGIAPEILPRLFTPCRSTHGGSGLGLAISRQLANQMGAGLRLKTTSAEGCVFELQLPAALFAEATLQGAARE
jgi:signal transduction histidine kinase